MRGILVRPVDGLAYPAVNRSAKFVNNAQWKRFLCYDVGVDGKRF